LTRASRHAFLLPKALRFAALAIRQAQHASASAARRIRSDDAARAPDEIGGVGADNQQSFFR
jgi:hypothetical protein